MKLLKSKAAIIITVACILMSMAFFLSQSPNKESLKLDFENLCESIRSADIKQIQKKLIYIPVDYVEGEKFNLYMTLSQTDQLLNLNIKQLKVIGQVGVITYTQDNDQMEIAIFAIHNGLHWQFHFSSSYWTEQDHINNATIDESHKHDAIALLKWLRVNTDVGKSGITSYERLGWYLPYVPQSLIIEEFYETPSPSMDHDYIWKIKIENTDTFKKFITQLTSPPPNYTGEGDYSAPPVFKRHPEWWQNLDFSKGTLKQYNIELVDNIKDGAQTTIYAFIDNQEEYIYIFTSS